jgi:hypothetical protein
MENDYIRTWSWKLMIEVDGYKAWKKNGRNQFEQGRMKKNSIPSPDEALIWLLFLLKKICMVGAALATAMVSSGRSMLAHQ